MLEVRIDRKRKRTVVEKLVGRNAGCDDEVIESAARERRVGALAQRGEVARVEPGEQVGHEGRFRWAKALLCRKLSGRARARPGVLRQAICSSCALTHAPSATRSC